MKECFSRMKEFIEKIKNAMEQNIQYPCITESAILCVAFHFWEIALSVQ